MGYRIPFASQKYSSTPLKTLLQGKALWFCKSHGLQIQKCFVHQILICLAPLLCRNVFYLKLPCLTFLTIHLSPAAVFLECRTLSFVCPMWGFHCISCHICIHKLTHLPVQLVSLLCWLFIENPEICVKNANPKKTRRSCLKVKLFNESGSSSSVISFPLILSENVYAEFFPIDLSTCTCVSLSIVFLPANWSLRSMPSVHVHSSLMPASSVFILFCHSCYTDCF